MANITNSDSLSITLKDYYDGLVGTLKKPPVIDVRDNERLNNDTFKDEINNLKNFLSQNGLNNTLSNNFGIQIKRTVMLAFFKRQQANKCLAVTNCFGLNKSIKNGGQIRLLQKGIFWKENDRLSIFQIVNNIFKNIRGNINYYVNFDLSNKITERRYNSFTERVESFYSTSQWKKVAHGFALPVDAMIEILEKNQYLGGSEDIKISFGLKTPNIDPDNLSSFSYYISDVDVDNTEFYIACRKEGGAAGDCPPEIPCKPGGGTTTS